MHMHIVLACPTLTQPSHRNPGSTKSAEFSVGDCHQQCSKSSKKKCFSNALRHTLVVLEMH